MGKRKKIESAAFVAILVFLVFATISITTASPDDVIHVPDDYSTNRDVALTYSVYTNTTVSWEVMDVTTPSGIQRGNIVDILKDGQLIARFDAGMSGIYVYNSSCSACSYLGVYYRGCHNGPSYYPTQINPKIEECGSKCVLSVNSSSNNGAITAHYSFTIYPNGSIYVNKTADVPNSLCTDECGIEDGNIGLTLSLVGGQPCDRNTYAKVCDNNTWYAWNPASCSGYGNIDTSHTLDNGDRFSVNRSNTTFEFYTEYTEGYDNNGKPSSLAAVVQYGQGYLKTLVGRKGLTMYHPTNLPAGQYITRGWLLTYCAGAELPELTLSTDDITFSNPTPTVGENITINATIHNIGNANATNVTVQFFDDGTQIGSNQTISSINAGGVGTTQVNWTATYGSHNISVVVDPYNVIAENNEANNIAYKLITIGDFSAWQYTRTLYIKENSGNDLTDYQVLINLSGNNFPTEANETGADIRFVDEYGNILNYWIEEYNHSARKARIWVKVPEIPANKMVTLQMYWGNPGATAMSDGDATFEFFDDFSIETIGSKWQINSGSLLLETETAYAYIDSPNSRAVIDSVEWQGFITKSATFSRPLIAEMKWNFAGAFSGKEYTAGIQYYDPAITLDFNRYAYHAYAESDGAYIRYGYASSYTNYPPSTIYIVQTDTWYIQRMVLTANEVRSEILNQDYDVLSYANITNDDWNDKKLGMDNFNDGSAGEKLYIDWIRVRKYTSPEPTVTFPIRKPHDFFVTGDSSGNVYIFPSYGNGSFASKQLVGYIGSKCLGTAIADFDNDGDLDFTIQSHDGKSYLFINNGVGNFTETIVAEGLSLHGWGQDATAADFNNDGYYDYVVPSSGSYIYLFTNNKNNTFSKSTISAEWLTNPRESDFLAGIDAGDFNEDGNMDFLVVEYNLYSTPNPVYLYTGNGNGTFTYRLAFTNSNHGHETLALVVGDFDNDGHPDAIVGQDDDGDPGQTWLYKGDGTGNFTYSGEAYDTNPSRESGSEYSGSGFADAYDFDGDGNLDVVANAEPYGGGDYGTFFFKGNENGTFQTPVLIDDFIGHGIAAPPLEVTPGEPLPDLTITSSDITFSNPIPAIGETIKIYATIHNIGNANATNVTVQFFDNEMQICSDKTISAINAGRTETAEVDWTAIHGSHNISVKVDPYNSIIESNEDNNIAFKSIIIGEFSDNFSTDSGMWTYIGDAYRDPTNKYVVLTENKNSQVGVIWFNQNIVSAFTVKFKYKAGGGSGADGFVFMFYKQKDYTPGGGGSLGFIGSNNGASGYGIEFDNWCNDEHSDPSSNHIALIKDHVNNHLKSVNDARTEDNKWHEVCITVGNSTITVIIDNETVLAWNGTIDRTYGGFGFSGATGLYNNWHIIDDVRVIYTPLPYTLSVTENQTTTIGGNALYTIKVHNLNSTPITLNLSISGLNESWYTLSKTSVFLIAGEEEDVILNITVPDDCNNTGTYPFKVFADSKSVTAELKVVAEPIISKLTPPDSAILSSNDVLFSWRTPVNSTTEVYIKAENESNFTQVIGDSGFIHAVTICDLTRNTNYEWYARSCSACGCAVSDTRTFYIDNGIVFTKDRYDFTVERDYDQRVSITVKNMDSEPHDLLVQAMNPYEDLIVGFVGNGSVDEIISLAPGETKDIEFVIHAQDAMLREYEFPVNLTNIGAENITDFAVVHVNIRVPNIDFDIVEVDSDPVTLVKTFRITNYGDTITDLKVFAGNELKDKIIFEPSIDHGRLGSGRSVDFKAKLVVKAGCVDGDCYGVNGTIFAQGTGKMVNVSANFTCEEGKKLFIGNVANYSLSFCKVYDEDDSPNTNPMSGEEVESYLVNDTKMFAAQVILDVHKNGKPVYGANVSLRVWNSSSEMVLDGISDKLGKALFSIVGPSDNYSYKAILSDYGIETGTRNFSVNETVLYEIIPHNIRWVSISDSNTTYNITEDFNESVILDNSPFVFRAEKDVVEQNESAYLILQWDIDRFKHILVSGTIENGTLLFETNSIPKGNWTAGIITISDTNKVSISKRINITNKDEFAIYKQLNYSFLNPFPFNETHMITLKIDHSFLSTSNETILDLYDIGPEANNSVYKFTYAVISNETKDTVLEIKVNSPNGTLYNYTSNISLEALEPEFINVTVPVFINGSLIEEFNITVSVGASQVFITVDPAKHYIYDNFIWVGSDRGIFEGLFGFFYEHPLGVSIKCGAETGLFLSGFTATKNVAVIIKRMDFGMSAMDTIYELTEGEWEGTAQRIVTYVVKIDLLSKGLTEVAEIFGQVMGVYNVINCAKNMWEALEVGELFELTGQLIAYYTRNRYCNNRPYVESTVDISSPIKEEDVKAAHLITNYELPWKRSSYRPHDVHIKINGREVGNITNTIPEGPYIFTFDPSLLNYPLIGVAKNVIALDTRHMNGGHYVVSGDMKILLELKNTSMIVCASNQSEADELIKQRSDSFSHKPDFAVHPAHIEFSNNYPIEGEEVNITAKIYNFGTKEASKVLVQFLDNGVEIGRMVGYMSKIGHEDIFVNYSWKCTQGWHNITVKINPDRTISELDYTNNEASKDIFVYGAPYTKIDVGVTSNITLASPSDLVPYLPPEYAGTDISDSIVLNVNITDNTPDNLTDDAYTDITIKAGELDIETCKVFKTGIGFLPEVDDVTTRPTVSGDPAFSRDLVNKTVTVRLYVGDPLLGVIPPAAKAIFDTGEGTYPSIMGTHKGEIKPSCNINVSKLYTYLCPGTGGHTESIELYENGELIANGTWEGYAGDWHNITLHNVSGAPYVRLLKGHRYNYTIVTGSYPQIIHRKEFNATGGEITCTQFVDANGRVYYDWIPAIKLS